ncbi:MAG: glycosyltransferase family 39 protein [Acidobacteriota bacterium]|nr:glycosyltransferase family 39 protein [Acidobacteriota bacterium]
MESEQRVSRWQGLALLAMLAWYVTLSVAFVLRVRPNNNEAWFANPAVDLLVRHTLGTPVLQGKGMWLDGIARHTYWTMPLYGLVQAPWYAVFGFSLVAQRMLTVVCGVGVLLCLFVLVRRLAGSGAALLAVLLAAVDSELIRLSAQGRMDMLCALLGLGGLAVYVTLRHRSLPLAVGVAHALGALACMTHPYGVLPATSLWALMLLLDARRMRLSLLLLAVAPYAAVLLAWGMYIQRDRSSFVSQFVGNMHGLQADSGAQGRFSMLLHPVQAIKQELKVRYLARYHSAVAPLAYLAGLLAMLAAAWRGRRLELAAIGMVGYLYVLELTLLESLKREFYLVHTIPVLAMCLAVSLLALRRVRWLPGWAVAAAVVLLVGVQAGTTLRQYRAAGRGLSDYFAVLHLLESEPAVPGNTGTTLLAPAEFAYRFGFYSGMEEDWQLGYATGTQPQTIVLGGLGQRLMEQHMATDPGFRQFVTRRLGQEYRLALQNASYRVYALSSAAPTAALAVPASPGRLWALRPLHR